MTEKNRHWSEMGEWSLIWGMRFLLRIYLVLGRQVLQWFLYPVVSYYWLLNTNGRLASLDYLSRIAAYAPDLGIPNGLWYSYRHFISFANAIIDKLAAWSGAMSLNTVEFHGREKLLYELQKGRGVILLGSHLGNLEVCRVIAAQDSEIKINVLTHTRHAEKFNSLLWHTNDHSSLNIIQVTEITAATSMLLSDKIDNGEIVIIAADRTPVSQEPRVCPAQFLGAEALFPQGPFILAALLKCPVLTLFCLKVGHKHAIYFDHFTIPSPKIMPL